MDPYMYVHKHQDREKRLKGINQNVNYSNNV